MEYGWNIPKDESISFGWMSREYYYANLLIDEIISKNVSEVRRLLKVHRARADVVVPERGTAALHVLAGLEAEDFAAAVTLRVLRRSGADPDVRSEEGLTPIHVAATYGRCQVLEILLTNGADPSLIDYRLLLDAKDLAYKERQWRAYAMLTIHADILKNEERLSNSKYLEPAEDALSYDQRSRADLGLEAPCTPDTSIVNCTENNSRRLDYGSSNEKGVCDWLKKTSQVIPLDENAVNMVKNHSRNTETYQFPDGLAQQSIENFTDKSSDISGSKLVENKLQSTKRLLEEKHTWLRSSDHGTTGRKDSRHPCVELEVNGSNSSTVDQDITTESNFAHVPRNEHDVESIKSRPNSKIEESKMYFYSYAERSLKSRGPHNGAAVSSTCHKSEVDPSKELSKSELCKMSRIYLIFLKKWKRTYRPLQ